MRGKRQVRHLLTVSVVVIALVSGAQAQTKPTAPATPVARGAFDKLSLGNQKVAAALYYAQSPRSASGTTHASRRLTLEEIATKRGRGQTWGQIFRDMKAQGLVHERTLGQVVARYQQTQDMTPGLLAKGGK